MFNAWWYHGDSRGLRVQHDRGVSRTPSGEIDTVVDLYRILTMDVRWIHAGPMIDKLCWANINQGMGTRWYTVGPVSQSLAQNCASVYDRD